MDDEAIRGIIDGRPCREMGVGGWLKAHVFLDGVSCGEHGELVASTSGSLLEYRIRIQMNPRLVGAQESLSATADTTMPWRY